jgi:hypothetical protein
MTVSLKHTFQSAKTDSLDATLVQPSNWNQEHILTAAAGKVLGRDTSGNGVVQELPISVTSAGNVTIPNNFAVTGTTGLTGNTTVTGTLGVTGTTTVADLNATGTVGFTNALAVTSGGTGVATLPANNVLIGNGTSAVTSVAPSTAGNVLTSNGTAWTSTPAATGAYTEFLNQSTDVTLVAANVGKVIVDPTVSIMVQLPDATTLTAGKTFEITNASDQNNLFVKSNDGTYQAFVAAGQTVNVTAENVSTAAGVWVADNPNYGFSSPVSFGYTGTYGQVSINSATAAISATKMIRINYGTSSNGGLTATIITKSGATITKGSEQFLLSSVAAGFRGFINVVMTSATTGIITNYGPNSSSGATNILLYTFSIDGSDVVQITGQDSIAVTLGTNSKGISIAALSATSVIIGYHISSNTYQTRILTLSSGLITAIGSTANIYTISNTLYPQIVALSSTLVVTGYFDVNDNNFYVKAGSVSGTTVTWGTEVLQTATSAGGTSAYGISRLSATEFIVSLGSSTTVLSNYGSVSGTTITLGAQDTYTGSPAVGSTMSYPISSTSALVVFYDATTGAYKPTAFVLTKSGTGLTRGTVYTLAASPAPTTGNASPFSLKGFVAFNEIQQPATDFYMDYATTLRVFAVPLSVSGSVVTPGTGILVTPENISSTVGQTPAICTLSKTRAIAFVYYNVSPDGTPGSRLYLLDTSGARPVVLATSSTISTAQVFCAGQLTATRAMIAYATNATTASTIRTLDITGDVFTFNTSITGSALIGSRPAIRKVNSTKAMLYVTQDATTDHRIYNIAISGTTVTQSASYITTGDDVAQTNTSRRILYSYGDVGYFFLVQSSSGYIVSFDVSGVSPTSAIQSPNSISSTIIPIYTALSGAGATLALGAGTTGAFTSAVSGTNDGNPKSFGSVGSDFNGSGITMPFNANSVMICGNGVNYYGKLATVSGAAATFTNNSLLNQTRAFAPSLAMHDSIQDWVDGDYFAPNSSKILFMGRNNLNLNYEMYHVFDKGAAQ